MKLIKIIRAILNPFGLDLKIYPIEDLRRRIKLYKHHGINKIIDVGANSGQYAKEMIDLGFKGKIESFEPVTTTYQKLLKESKRNATWTAHNFALGNTEEELQINISKNTYSSSLLKIKENHIKSAPESIVVSKELIKVKTLDSIFDKICNHDDIVLLKLDVQGFEKNVLDGSLNCLPKIKGIQIEMSLEELYDNEMLFTEMLNFIESKGFKLQSLENQFSDIKSGKLLQVDGIFFKK